MKKLYSSQDAVLLRIIKEELAQEGIATIIKNEFPPAAGEITPVVAWPEIWLINDHEYHRAVQVMQKVIPPTNQSLPRSQNDD